jgi:hypothetical protein
MKIDEVEISLLQHLFHDGWALKLDDDIADDFKSFCAFKKDGPLNAFTRLDVILFSLDNNPEDVAIRFLFQADPDKWSIGKQVQANNYETLRLTCEYLLNKSGMNAEERHVNIGGKSTDNRGFDNGRPYHINPAYNVELVYWNQP